MGEIDREFARGVQTMLVKRFLARLAGTSAAMHVWPRPTVRKSSYSSEKRKSESADISRTCSAEREGNLAHSPQPQGRKSRIPNQ
jgi:hypothetical protein